MESKNMGRGETYKCAYYYLKVVATTFESSHYPMPSRSESVGERESGMLTENAA
jgi:hypothetical protein